MKKFYFLFLLLFCFFNSVISQNTFILQNNKSSDKIRFKLINNLIVFPVEVNGVELSFLLDTGVSKTLIFNILNISDSLKIKQSESFFLRGLGGGGTIEALKSDHNFIRIGNAIKVDQELYAIYDKSIDFAPKLGVPIHGIIGADLLKDFIVEINYSKKYFKLNMPYKYEYQPCSNCETFNLEFHNNKPYMYAITEIDNTSIPVKLLIDSGGSDALWLFKDDEKGIKVGRYFDDFLGHGLNGSVYGKRSKIDGFQLKHFKLKHVNVAFPNENSINFSKMLEGRNGTISGEILRRFTIILDYGRAKITLKKNSKFKEKFDYNKSGMVLEYSGYRMVRTNKPNYTANDKSSSDFRGINTIAINDNTEISLKPSYAIVELRENSPAERAGLQMHDVILSINGKSTSNYTLQQVTKFFYAEKDKLMRITVDRKGIIKSFSFKLEDPLNKKT
ncbi:MAG: aspartyl protease family protein [Jejuia sp.]